MAEDFKYNRFEGMSPMRKAALILSEGAMAFGEGLSGKPFHSNYMERDSQNAKMAYEQWKEKQQADPRRIIGQMVPYLAATGNTEMLNKINDYLQQNPETTNAPVTTGNTGVAGGAGDVNVSATFGGKSPSIRLSPSTKEPASATVAKEMSETQNFISQFGRAYQEQVKAFPEIGEEGYVGWATRKGGQIANYFDQLPETKAFQVEKLPLANKMARTIEGGRVTDKDREVYANSFADSLEHPTSTNIRLVSNNLLKLHQKGGDITQHLAELNSSEIDIFPKIVAEVLKAEPKLKEEVLRKTYQLNPQRFEAVE